MSTLSNYTRVVLRRTIFKCINFKPYIRKISSQGNIDYTPGTDPTSRLIWVDLELTGLSFEKDRILEATCVITEANLDIVDSCSNLIIHQPEEILDKMVPWCQGTHRKTGLYDEVLKSTLTVEKAEERLLEFVRKHTEPGTCPLAGNTVYMDRFFLAKYMPTFEQYMHYRIVDVSTIKELCRRWNRDVYTKAPEKSFIHRAEADINESIEELKYYKKCLFDPKTA